LKVVYRKKFLKELAKIPLQTREKIEEYVFNNVPLATSVIELKKIERLKGYPAYYKIRFGNYRVGLKQEGDELIFERVLHRRDIYKYYP